MSPPPDRRPPGAPDEWLRHAESDLALARLARESGDVLPGQICFHAQQAAEKALKAVLLAHSIPFPLTHDLEILLQLARQAGLELDSPLDDLPQLTPYAVETRYPGYGGNVSPSDVDDAVRHAGQALEWARGLVRTT